MLLGGSSTQGGLEQRNARFFVDLASSNGLTHSNTRTLERDHGWRGLCIEANSRFWPALIKRRACRVVGAAVAEQRAEMDFHQPTIHGMGGLVRPGTKNARQRASYRVQAVPLAEIFREFRVPSAIDYMSLDVEGAESLVMRTFPFETHTVAVLSVEAPHSDLTALLRSHGYRYHCTSVGPSVLWSLRNADELWLHATTERLVPTEAKALRADPSRSGRATCSKCGAKFRHDTAPLARCDVLYAGAALAMTEWGNVSRA